MSSQALAAVLSAPQGSFTVEQYEVPEPGAGQFLLRTELVGVCGTDTHIYNGQVPGIPYPVVLGHEFVGVIEQLGTGVTYDTEGKPIKVGDRVVPMPATPCGVCYECVVKPGPVVNCPNYDVTGFTNNEVKKLAGGMSQIIHHQNPHTRFFKTNLPAEIAVLTEPFSTPVHGVQRVGIKPGDTVLVQGVGTVGLLSVAAALSAGASRVIVIGGPKRRLEVAKAFGIDAFKTFDIIFVLTGGGPGIETRTLNLLAFKQGIEFLKIGPAASIAILMLITIIIATRLFLRYTGPVGQPQD